MILEWSILIGLLLCLELAVLITLISPIIGPIFYNYVTRPGLECMRNGVRACFMSTTLLLNAYLMDSYAEMQKFYSSKTHQSNNSSKLKDTIKILREQGNMCIVSFTIFFAIVIKRLFSILGIYYKMQLKTEKVINEAEDVMKLAKKNLSETKEMLKNLKNVAKKHGSCPCIVTALKVDEVHGQ